MKRNVLLGLVAFGILASRPLSAVSESFPPQVDLSELTTQAAKMSNITGYSARRGGRVSRPVVGETFISYSRPVASLGPCGGTVELRQMGYGQVNLVFRGVQNCSNFDILSANGMDIKYPNRKLGGYDRNRSGSFTLPQGIVDFGSNGVLVKIQSNSGKTREYIRVYFWAF